MDGLTETKQDTVMGNCVIGATRWRNADNALSPTDMDVDNGSVSTSGTVAQKFMFFSFFPCLRFVWSKVLFKMKRFSRL